MRKYAYAYLRMCGSEYGRGGPHLETNIFGVQCTTIIQCTAYIAYCTVCITLVTYAPFTIAQCANKWVKRSYQKIKS